MSMIFCMDGESLTAVHDVTTWDGALQAALDNGPLFDFAIILDLAQQAPPDVLDQARNTQVTGPEGHTEPFPVEVALAHTMDEVNANLSARHRAKLQGAA